jgi:peptide deformylase
MNIITDKEKLHKKTSCFIDEKEEILKLYTILILELKKHDGQSLAANQLGFDKSIFVMKRNIGPSICIVNPIITKEKGSIITTEYCLSIPGESFPIKRPKKVTVNGFNQYLNHVKYKFEGIEARRACHVIDHLNGILIGDI